MRKNKFVALILMLSMVLCSASLLAPVAFAEGETTEPTVYYFNDFDSMSSVPTDNFAAESTSASPFLEYATAGCSFSLVERNGGNALKVVRNAGQKPRLQFHITDHPGASGTTVGKQFVFSFKINPQSLTTMSMVLMDGFKHAFNILNDGSIIKGNQVGGTAGTVMAKIALGEWSQINMVVNSEAHTFALYINGEKCYQDSFDSTYGTLTRLYIEWMDDTRSTSTVLFDDFCVASDFSTATANVIGQNIALEDNTLVRFYTQLNDAAIAEGAKATLTVKAADGKKDIVKTYSLLNAPKYEELENAYYFTVGVPAAMMTDTVTLTVTDACGNVIAEKTYSVRTYCVNMIEKAKAEGAAEADKALAEMCRNILNYGAAAQTYFNYKPDTLANAGLVD